MIKKTWLLALFVTFAVSLNAKPEQVTVVVSLDGFRADYPQWYDTPFFDHMANKGVESGLIPSFPSKTFPNHYTLATGLYPDHHGIVANSFIDAETGDRFSLSNMETKYNAKYYGGEPIWLTAQRQGLHTAVYYWPGSDVPVNGQYPDTYFKYDSQPRLTFEQRLDGVISQLERTDDERPSLIMAYFEEPDHSGHWYGPQSKATQTAVELLDSIMGSLYERMLQTPVGSQVNFIIVSDHGMTSLSEQRLISLDDVVKPEWVIDIDGSVPANIYVKAGCEDSVYHALGSVDHLRYWRKGEIPDYLHYGSNPRVGDIVAVPDLGWIIKKNLSERGTHGFDPEFEDMHAIFRAVGPSFRHVSLPHFQNTNLYVLLCHLLGVIPSENDGSIDVVKHMLKDTSGEENSGV